jgi:L-2-hydroxyglutarate oxidase LhgO
MGLCPHMLQKEVVRSQGIRGTPSKLVYRVIFKAPDDNFFYRIHITTEDKPGITPAPRVGRMNATRVVSQWDVQTDESRWVAYYEPVGLINPDDFTVRPT